MARGAVTMSDVARLAGVSKMTVSNVVNNRNGVSEPVRRRVLEAIRESGYRLNVSARTLKSGRTGVIGLAVPDMSSYFGYMAMNLITAAEPLGFHVAVEQTAGSDTGELDAIAQSHRLQFDGLILQAVGVDPRHQRIPAGDIPILLMGEQDFQARHDHVLMPNEEGSKAATLHLFDQGCTRVATVTGSKLDRVNVESRRYRGYLAAHDERGLAADPDLLVPLKDMSLEGGREAAYRLVDTGRDFDAVVAVTDTVAQGLMRGLADRGVRVPDRVRVIGYDDIPEAAFTVPSLSTVRPDHRWMAEKAVELIAARIEDPSRPAEVHIAPFELKVRESTS